MIRVVLGLGFGDEGKGTIVDWLARRSPTPPVVVRWNGGPQAAHHVVTVDGAVHCFAQLGSASFVDGARTHLGPRMAVDLHALHAELAALGRPARVTIDPRCVLVTPWHAIVGRVRELRRGAARHGTTGRGVAEAVLGAARDQLTAAALGAGFSARLGQLRARLAARARELASGDPEAEALAARADDDDLRDAYLEAATRTVEVTSEVPRGDQMILEGAQGALLDRDHGFFPHVTPSRITRAAAEAAARELGLAGELEVWGVLRAYHTRHGAGPLPSEDAALGGRLPEAHNVAGQAGAFRVGWFDAVLARHALGFAGPIDRLAVTCLDRVATLPARAIVDAWDRAPLDTAAALAARVHVREVDDVGAAIGAALGHPIDVESWGPTAADKRPARGPHP